MSNPYGYEYKAIEVEYRNGHPRIGGRAVSGRYNTKLSELIAKVCNEMDDDHWEVISIISHDKDEAIITARRERDMNPNSLARSPFV